MTWVISSWKFFSHSLSTWYSFIQPPVGGGGGCNRLYSVGLLPIISWLNRNDAMYKKKQCLATTTIELNDTKASCIRMWKLPTHDGRTLGVAVDNPPASSATTTSPLYSHLTLSSIQSFTQVKLTKRVSSLAACLVQILPPPLSTFELCWDFFSLSVATS